MIFEEDKAFARAMLGDDVVKEAEENATLVHYGIKGMKWGVWNAETRERHSRDRKIKKERLNASKNRRGLSAKELRERIDRLKAEKELKQLTDEDAHPVRVKTKKFLKDLAKGLGIAGLGAGGAYVLRTALKGLKKNDTPGIVPKGTKVPRYTYDANEAKKAFNAADMLKEILAKKKNK